MPNTPSLKCPEVYEALRRDGMSKEAAAKISNAMFSRGKCGGKKEMSEQAAFMVTTDKAGRPRWIAVSSSAYLDRDNEIVSRAALEADVARADKTKEYGPLLWWHTGAKLGDCDYNALHGRMLVESGTFLDESIAGAVAQKSGELGLSIGFRHPATEPKDGVFETIRRYERSLLPKRAASNPYTVLTVKGADMNGEKLAELEALLGAETTAKVLAVVETTDKAAEAEGVRHKEQGLLSRLGAWLLGQPEVTDATKEAGDAESEEEAPPAEAAAQTEAAEAGATDGEGEAATKAADEDPDELPVTAADLKTVMATLRKEMSDMMSKTKETDTSALATKVEVAAVLDKLNAVEAATDKAVRATAALAGDLPRGVAGVFRASQAEGTATEKAQALSEKAVTTNDPLDSWVSSKFGA
jgi:hypothetical protein